MDNFYTKNWFSPSFLKHVENLAWKKKSVIPTSTLFVFSTVFDVFSGFFGQSSHFEFIVPVSKFTLLHAVGVLSRFMSKPGKEHWTTVKRVFRYLHGTSDYGFCYQGRPGLDRVLDIHGFVYANWAGDLD